MDETRDLVESGEGGCIATSAARKKQMQRRQTSPAEAVAMATPPVAQKSGNSLVLELLIDLLSRMSVTKEYKRS